MSYTLYSHPAFGEFLCPASVTLHNTVFSWLLILNNSIFSTGNVMYSTCRLIMHRWSPARLSVSGLSLHYLSNHPSIKILYRRRDCGDSLEAGITIFQQLSPALPRESLCSTRPAGQFNPFLFFYYVSHFHSYSLLLLL